MQLDLDFSRIENNPESNKILRENEKLFSKQCETVYELLKRGKYSVRDLVLLGIGDPRRRIKDLRDAGVRVKDELIEGRFKKYFL